MINEAATILAHVLNVCLIPNAPIFFLKLKANNIVQNMAAMLVPKAKPAIPIYLDRTMLTITFTATEIVALIMGVLVSLRE